MTHKTQKRISKIKKKRKAKRKALKKNERRRLAHSAFLEPFLDYIIEEYKPVNISLFRWVHNPTISDDFKPQIFQENSPIAPEEIKIPPADAPKKVIFDYTDRFTLSNYVTIEDAKAEWNNTLGRRLKGKPEERKKSIIEKWIKSKGEYVVKVDYTEDTAIVGPQSDDGAHKQAFLFEGIDGASLIDKTFKPIKIEYYDAT